MIRITLPIGLLLALSGCGGQDSQAPKAAEGEVLPGSVSDAMLPYDTATSAPPLASPGAVPAPRGMASESADTAVVGEGGAGPEPEAT